ncbi:MAG: zinc-binding dehydrogenase [Acidimicrobiales bacterium]
MAARSATAWVVTRLSAPTEALEIQTVEVADPGPSQVRIDVEAFCLDFNDIDTVYGRYHLLQIEPPFVVGMAAAGTVEAAGPGGEAFLGRRVVGVTSGVRGGYASAALLDTSNLQMLPEWISAEEGIAMYFPYLLSFLALSVRGRIDQGDVVLIHAAAGGVGSAAVQLAKSFGATVIATAGTNEKIEFCRSIGADYGVNYRSGDFVSYVDDVMNGRGVDIAFDTVGGDVTTETFRVMAFNGRHLIIGFASGIEAEERPIPMMPGIYGNFDLVGVCFAFVDSPRATRPFGMNFLSTAQGVEIWSRILHLARAGKIRPVIGRQINFGDVPSQLDALERRETIGRTVVKLSPGH